MVALVDAQPSLKLKIVVVTVSLLAIVAATVRATDPDPLQDFCIADLNAGVFVNGYACKNPANVTTEDFAFSGLAQPGNVTGTPLNAAATFAFVREWPALNTLGLSLVRLDFNPGGVISPHTHNLATEIIYCLEGEIYTGFVSNSDNPTAPNRLYAKVLKAGEMFIFPRGLLHFQINKGSKPAASINVLNSQSPGIQLIPKSLFAVQPPIDPVLLAKSFFIDQAEVEKLLKTFSQVTN